MAEDKLLSINPLSELVDEYAAARALRLAEQKKVNALDEREKELKTQLIQALKEAGASAHGGQFAVVRLVMKKEPTIENWDLYYKHVRDTGEFELLYRRANPAAIKERMDAGVNLPGVGWFPVETLSISKV